MRRAEAQHHDAVVLVRAARQARAVAHVRRPAPALPAEAAVELVCAYWDQRGAGRSFDPEADPRKLTIARHLADLDRVVDHLRRTFGRDEVVLIGHSWGGALGVLYARDHPSKVAAFVAVAPVVAASAGQQAEYDFVLSEASRRNDGDALARLRELGAPPYDTPAAAIALGRLTDRYGGVFHEPPNRPWLVLSGIFGGLVTPWEIPVLVRGTEVSLAAMYEELLGLDLPQSAPSIDVPVFFLLGRHDRHIEAGLAARYLESLRAPSKKLIWFERSAHNVPFEEPERSTTRCATPGSRSASEPRVLKAPISC